MTASERIDDDPVAGKGWTTKDSGKRQEYVSGMRRDIQSGKPRFDLLVVDNQPYDRQFLTRFAALLERGAEKYGERNWQLADSSEELARFKASAHRHFMQWSCGESDEDHMAAVAFNLMAYEYVKWKLEHAQVKQDSEFPQILNCCSGDSQQCETTRLGQERSAPTSGFLRRGWDGFWHD